MRIHISISVNSLLMIPLFLITTSACLGTESSKLATNSDIDESIFQETVTWTNDTENTPTLTSNQVARLTAVAYTPIPTSTPEPTSQAGDGATTISPTTTSTEELEKPTEELDYSIGVSSFTFPEFNMTIEYPENWDHVFYTEFRGSDGYIKINKLDGYSKSPITYVCSDYILNNSFDTEDEYKDISVYPTAIDDHGACGIYNKTDPLATDIVITYYEKNSDGRKYILLEISGDRYNINITWDDEEFLLKQVINNQRKNFITSSGLIIDEYYAGEAYQRDQQGHFSWIDFRGSTEGENFRQQFLKYPNDYCFWFSQSDEESYQITNENYKYDVINTEIDGWGYLTVYRNDEIVFSAPSPKVWALCDVSKFCVWDDHWMVEELGYIKQDGILLNHELDYEYMFGWRLLNNYPLYFFVDNGQFKISYNNETLDITYDYISSYSCGEVGSSKIPLGNEEKAWFYGVRDGAWYFVTITNE